MKVHPAEGDDPQGILKANLIAARLIFVGQARRG